MLYFDFLLSPDNAITIEYYEANMDLSSTLVFAEKDSMKISVDGNVAIRRDDPLRVEDPRDDHVSFMDFSDLRGGTVVFTFKSMSPVAELMDIMRATQVSSIGLFAIKIIFDKGRVISFDECAFGVQSEMNMLSFSIEFLSVTLNE